MQPVKIRKRPIDIKRERITKEGSEYMTGLMFDLSLSRYLEQIGGRPEQYMPISFRVDLTQLSPLARRLALGLSAVTPNWKDHELLLKDEDGHIVQWEWDVMGDDETPEAYLNRHADHMGQLEIVSLPREPSFMQSSVANEWAHSIGFQIPLSTIRRFVSEHGVELFSKRHIQPNVLFHYLLHVWSRGR